MVSELLEIPHRELKFTFELKKQSSCSVQLVNKSNEYVAFKVKTTSPKRYCVRPNTGVIPPRSTCDFTVTMQAQKHAPVDMQLKDKFLVQGTIVPFGTTEEDIVPSFFSKENGRYIEEHKLRVVLVSPPHSPVLHPINGSLKQDPTYEAPIVKEAHILKEVPIISKDEPSINPIISKDQPSRSQIISKDQPLAIVEDLPPPSHVAKDVEDLTLKINDLEMKLNETDKTLAMLTEEKFVAVQERDKSQQEIALLRRKCAARVQVGFPPFFVVFMALVGLVLGYMLHP